MRRGIAAALTALSAALSLLAGADPAGAVPVSRRHADRPCFTYATPPRTHVTFAQATPDGQIANELIRAVCSAAQGATIRISMFSVKGGGSGSRVLGALHYVHERRGVQVQLVVEAGPASYWDPELRAYVVLDLNDFSELRGFEVTRCFDTCHHGPARASQHSKVLLISQTRFGTPLTLIGSANIRESQLDQRWQSFVTLPDPTVYALLRSRFDQMRACAPDPRCKDYGGDPDVSWRPVSSGAMLLSPYRGTGDPIAQELESLTCRPGSRVSVQTLFVYPTRPRVVEAISRLRARGCQVTVVVRPDILARAAKIPGTRCQWTHDKVIFIDAYRGGRHLREVLTGSQNLAGASLTLNDDVVLRTSEPAVVRGYEANTMRSYLAASEGACGEQIPWDKRPKDPSSTK